MIELICPFCNKKLEPIGTSGQFQCGTWGCDASFNFIATRDVWKYIDRTRKALDVGVEKAKALKELAEIAGFSMFSAGCQDIIEQITATLENQNGNC